MKGDGAWRAWGEGEGVAMERKLGSPAGFTVLTMKRSRERPSVTLHSPASLSTAFTFIPIGSKAFCMA